MSDYLILYVHTVSSDIAFTKDIFKKPLLLIDVTHVVKALSGHPFKFGV